MENTDTLQTVINDLIEERLNISYSKLIQNERYKEIERNHTELCETISGIVKKEEMLEKYKQCEYDMYGMQLREAYKIGLADGIIAYKDFCF